MTTRDVQIAILRRLVEYESYDEVVLAAMSGAVSDDEWECSTTDVSMLVEFFAGDESAMTVYYDLETDVYDGEFDYSPRALLERLLAQGAT